MLRSLFPYAKMLALTATATIKMREEIGAHLAMKTPVIIAAPMDRSNIKMKVSTRNPNGGMQRTVEESFDSIFQPLV